MLATVLLYPPSASAEHPPLCATIDARPHLGACLVCSHFRRSHRLPQAHHGIRCSWLAAQALGTSPGIVTRFVLRGIGASAQGDPRKATSYSCAPLPR